MEQRVVGYSSYGYPYTWGYSGYSPQNYGYLSPTPATRRSSLPPMFENKPRRDKPFAEDKTGKKQCLIVAVVILVILLLIAIIGIIFLAVEYKRLNWPSGVTSTTVKSMTAAKTTTIGETTTTITTTTTTASDTTTTESLPTTTPIPPTVIGFNVTNTKLPYEDGLAQQYSALFNMTNAVFCNQINEWLDNQYGTDECLCIKFERGIIATVHLTIGSSFGTSEKLLTDIRSVIPEKSTAEPDINAIKAEDIVIID